MKGGKSELPYLWDIKAVDSGAQLFYTSQLVPRIAVTRINGKLNMGEEYVPLQVNHVEKIASAGGEALEFDLETAGTAIQRAIERFGMPASIKGQRIRYSWVIYGPAGLAAAPLFPCSSLPLNRLPSTRRHYSKRCASPASLVKENDDGDPSSKDAGIAKAVTLLRASPH